MVGVHFNRRKLYDQGSLNELMINKSPRTSHSYDKLLCTFIGAAINQVDISINIAYVKSTED